MHFYVYQLIDPRNNKVFYVGKGCKNRMYEHVNNVRKGRIPNHSNTKLGNKIKKILSLGLKVKYKKVLITENEQEAYNKERAIISKIGLENLCNLTEGGDGCLEINFSDEHKQKISNANKGRNFSDEHRKKLSDAHKGMKQSTETIQKRLESRSWYKHSDETKEKLSIAHTGKILTDEHKKKLSESHKGNTSGCGNKGKIPWNKGNRKGYRQHGIKEFLGQKKQKEKFPTL